MIVTGLMSGTSADGMDVAICEITGAPPRLQARVIHANTVPYPRHLRDRILAACDPATGRVDVLCTLNVALAQAFAEVVLETIHDAGMTPQAVDLIGSHGQTVWHNVLLDGTVDATLQITEGAELAERTGITTINNFRARDVAAGGQGAPLTGYVDWLLLRHETEWRAVQNIGGMGNVTLLPPLCVDDVLPLAFDTGPGNALIDIAVTELTNGAQTFDHGGLMAARGRIDEDWLTDLLAHPYYHRRPPKTTGREIFGTEMAQELVQIGRERELAAEDIVATLTMLTAQTIADAYAAFIDVRPREIIVGGGGRHNTTMVSWLQDFLAPITVLTHEDVGINSDHKEALVFAVLAYESWHNRPGTLPSLTGARHATVLGQITPGNNFASLARQTWG